MGPRGMRSRNARAGLRAGQSCHRRERIREAVTRNKTEKLTALTHHITVDALRLAFLGLKRDAAPGVDGMTGEQYDVGLERNLIDLHRRVHAGTYRAQPSRRKYIPKPDGRQRPLGIASLEDKIVQGAVVAILTPVYEAEFLGFSYGFRPGRSQHQALDALYVGMTRRKVNWVLDADITKFFDTISHDWMIRFVSRSPRDRRRDERRAIPRPNAPRPEALVEQPTRQLVHR
jgi:RNA-directed DNA polymerase